MKLFLPFIACVALVAACSDDDGGSTQPQHHYSAHMKTICPSDSQTPIYDVCVSEAVFYYLGELRDNTPEPNSCLMVTFEGLDGEVHEDYLIRIELNQTDCSEFQ